MSVLPLALAAVLAAGTGPPASTSASAREIPVLVELFTSEGCSSCPPADATLARLLARPPEGVRVIALGEHVDYWDELGWKDRLAAPAFTSRQEAYVRRLQLAGPYTPQLVVNGQAQSVGGDERAARAAIAAAARDVGGTAEVLVRAQDGAAVALELRAAWGGARPADVLVALVQDHARTRVLAGENAGRVLEHVAVVRSLARVGGGAGSFRGAVRVGRTGLAEVDRVVIVVQEPDGGPVRAVASAALPREQP